MLFSEMHLVNNSCKAAPKCPDNAKHQPTQNEKPSLYFEPQTNTDQTIVLDFEPLINRNWTTVFLFWITDQHRPNQCFIFLTDNITNKSTVSFWINNQHKLNHCLCTLNQWPAQTKPLFCILNQWPIQTKTLFCILNQYPTQIEPLSSYDHWLNQTEQLSLDFEPMTNTNQTTIFIFWTTNQCNMNHYKLTVKSFLCSSMLLQRN